MSNKKPKSTEIQPIEANVSSVEFKVPELEVFKKISTLSSLASACEDETLLKAFGKMKHGQKLYELFVKAVHQEIQSVISGKEIAAIQPLNSVKDLAGGIYDQVQTMYNMMAAVSNSPIMKVLAIVHDKMTGSSLEDTLARSAAAQRFQQPPPNYEAAHAAAEEVAKPQPHPAASAPQPAPATNNPPLARRYAGGKSNGGTPAPALPPRSSRIDGIF